MGLTPVKGEDRHLDIEYAEGGALAPFLRLSVPAEALDRLPDGTAVAPGDPVLITLTVDAETIQVRFAPSGLTFDRNTPARLELWYAGADSDLTGDGAVDGSDAYVEQELLGLWHQDAPETLWTSVSAVHDVAGQVFQAPVFGFSGYAISWFSFGRW